MGAIITLAFPFYCIFLLSRNINLLDNEEFRSKHGSLYQGFRIDNALKRKAAIIMVGWFLFRRFLTAVNLIYLRDQTIWIQLTINMYLSLIDLCVKIELSSYESRIGGIIEQFNDLFVVTLSYFPFLFTDLIQSQEDKYYIGWYYMGLIAMLVAANIFVMVITASQDVKDKLAEMVEKCKKKKETEAQNAQRKLQKEVMLKVKENKVDGAVVSVLKPSAPELLHTEDHQAHVEKYKAFKRYERKMRKAASLAAI